ncbi:YfjI family protein [Rhodosalinus sediminis]|uniref:YfjI family protein n=1 Tax=Rhodosalinus sediminis TaxID=1940533 RepID=UPI0023535E3D|nr:YfjI family protein [Rhodosalinus sediminis]
MTDHADDWLPDVPQSGPGWDDAEPGDADLDADLEALAATTEGPTPLIREMPEAQPYPAEALGALREPAEAIARATEAPIALCAASVLAAAALAAQGHRDAETLNGTAPASLFLLTVAESGERKSTADRLAMRGVRDFEADLRTDYETERDAWKDAQEVWKAQRAKIVGDKKADAASKRADLKALGPEPPAPLKPHIVASAPTVEGITKHLPELRGSLGIMTEEGGALIGGHSMKAENRLATCASLSAMWDGAPLDRWRAGDGVEVYTGRRFSAHILVQPVAAEALLADPMANGQGLVARFLTCRPTSRIGGRLRMERDATAEAEIARFAARIRALLSRPLPVADGTRNELAPPILPLSSEARAVLTDFAREVETAQAPGGPFEDARAFASKTAEHAARIAAVLTIFADPDAAEVTGETMAGATAIATFYANEAARLADAAVIPPEVAEAERMRKWLLTSWSEPFISARSAAQRGPFKVTDRARRALKRLEDYGWLIEANGAEVEGKPRKEAWRIVREAAQ